MTRDLFSSLESFASASPSPLLVCEGGGQYRPAVADEVLQAAQRVLASQVRGTNLLDWPAVVKDFLRMRLGALSHEVFAVVHLDAQNRALDYVEMFRGTVSQTSVYPREVVKDALVRGSVAVMLVHNHPSGVADPSRAGRGADAGLEERAVAGGRAGARSPHRGWVDGAVVRGARGSLKLLGASPPDFLFLGGSTSLWYRSTYDPEGPVMFRQICPSLRPN